MSLIESLQKPDLFAHPVTQFEVLETHISWVLLTGPFAYKIKKPVNFGFVDFSTLEKRHHFCQEELRLNRRLAPHLYLDVISIRGSTEQPTLSGNGPVIEYAVKMRQFAQSDLLPNVLAQRGIKPALIDNLAATVARFHSSIAVVPATSPYGDPTHIRQPVLENFTQIRANLEIRSMNTLLTDLETWSQDQLHKLDTIFRQRKAEGYVRECHGDMHLRNMALIDDDIVVFDCIEFNKNFYLIDVLSEIAFLVMDLEDREQGRLAIRFLNQYLELTGDYRGLQVLNFYKVYRAMVRAKVDALRASQEEATSSEYQQTRQDCLGYLELASAYTTPTSPCLLINHGLSGSGKSYISKQLLEVLPAIRLRSDIERKRIHGHDPQQRLTSELESGLYSPQATERTYQHLVAQATVLLQSGYSVIIDAANLKQSQRRLFLQLASDLGCPAIILHYQAEEKILRQRVSQRLQSAQDASDADLLVLEHQLLTRLPLAEDEVPMSITVNTEQDVDISRLVDQISARIQQAK